MGRDFERGCERDARLDRERTDEMLSDLAEAVFAGDLARAEGVLNLMHASGRDSDWIRQAKYRAGPELAPRGATLREPFVLPAPGAQPGDFLGGPNERLAPKRRRRAA